MASWAEPECLAPQSFALHAELVKRHGGEVRWGYRRVHCADCNIDTTNDAVKGPLADACRSKTSNGNVKLPKALHWVDPGAFQSYDICGDPSNTAQVHPYSFTIAMSELAAAAGAKIQYCTVKSINLDQYEGRVQSVTCEGLSSKDRFDISADEIVIAAGPWTSSICPEALVGGAKSHSIVVRPSKPLTNHTLTATLGPQIDYWTENEGGPTIIEMYPRPDKTLYACAFCDAGVSLPSTSLEVHPSPNVCQGIFKAAKAVASTLENSQLIVEQACFQPVVLHEGKRRRCVGPIVGPAKTQGLFLALAHDSWGIQNGPVTGKAISELIFDGEAQVADLDTLRLEAVLQRARQA